MTGLDDEDDGIESFRPVPHPDDRLWRHPAEVAAELAAQRAAEAAAPPTVELPKIQPVDPTPRRPQRALAVAAAVALIGASAVTIGSLIDRTDDSTVTALASTPQNISVTDTATPTDTDDLVEPAAAGVRPATGSVPGTAALETVAVDRSATDAALAARLHDQLAPSMPRVQVATPDGMREGSGFFVTDRGHLVTSARLVADADYLLVWTDDGGRWHADLIAYDTFSDVAVLMVVDAPSTPATFKDTVDLWAGQYALAIDHERSDMTVGAIASLVAAAHGVQPGDLASRFRIEPGMAPGAAIVDDTGSIIGLVNATDQAVHATPGWMVQRVTAELLASGIAVHPWLGVHAEPADAGRVRLLTIVGGSPADIAGLRAGDVIDAVNGAPISATSSFWTLVQRHEPGDRVDLAVTRNGERRLVQVVLAEVSG